MKFGSKRINPGTGRLVTNRGKGDKLLPSPAAVHKLAHGNPSERSFQSYAKHTPSGRNAPFDYQTIIDMGTLGAGVRGK